MKRIIWLVFLFALIVGLAGCRAKSPAEDPAAPSGPALIMFYTDN